LDELSDPQAAIADDAVDRRNDVGKAEVQLRLFPCFLPAFGSFLGIRRHRHRLRAADREQRWLPGLLPVASAL
jgi:hypothetical protein